MVFNSLDFFTFIIPVLLCYWFIFRKTKTLQNVFLLLSSFIFYSLADWRFLGLLIVSILVNYYLAITIHKQEEDKRRNFFLYIGLFFNIGLLLYFKYFNFFYAGFYDFLAFFGTTSAYSALHILLPLGISFFTFQTLGYLLDVYNEEITPTENFLDFSVFIAFFPKILSGPIERATNLLPQLKVQRAFSYEVFVDGLRQILWGLFAKIVIAENCAAIINPIFADHSNQPGSSLVLGMLFYAIQLYADFSGYSNIAIGVSKLFGIQLMRNFSTPFFSTNIGEFWRKWHISLTTWMLDYVFTPLSFTLRRYHKKGLVLAIIATFVLVGFWHGANWTFIVYGFFHGFYFIPLVYSGTMNSSDIVAKGKWLPSFKEAFKMIALFILVMMTDVFFRAENVAIAFEYLNKIFSRSILDAPLLLIGSTTLITFTFIGFYLAVEWIHRERSHDFEISTYNVYFRWSFYILLFVSILIFGRSSETFIYFQF